MIKIRDIFHNNSSNEFVDLDIAIRRSLTSMLILAHLRGDAHVVSCIGSIQILCNLFKKDFNPYEDDLIISKGHAALALYSTLYEFNVISKEQLMNFRREKSDIGIHVSQKHGAYSRLSTGSLGHGIGFGAGIALAKKISKKPGKVYVMVGDGELNEGSNFEALQFASSQALSNLTILVDHNEVQSVAEYSEVSGNTTLHQKFKAFGCISQELGKNKNLSFESFYSKNNLILPQAFVCFTSMFPYIPSMQRNVLWHYRKPDSKDLNIAFGELNSRVVASDYCEWLKAI